MRIRWLKHAKKNLDEAMEYIAHDNPIAAIEMYKHIRIRIEELAKHPGQGRPGRVYGTRELVIEKYSYLVPYRVINNEIVILRVFHTSQKLPAKW